MTDIETDVLVLGGGVSGLSAYHGLRRAGRDALVVDANDGPGGLLRSFTIDGFTFDHAVHLSFATEPEVRAQFDRVPYFVHKPESLNWETDRWLRHPVQNNLFPLEVEDKLALIDGLIDAHETPADRNPRNYEDWLIAQYGKPIAKRYPMRYTRKYWRCDARELGTDWIGKRMRRADLREVVRGAMTADKRNTYYVNEMRYPKQGGYFTFIRDLAETANVISGVRVVGLSIARSEAQLDDGRRIRFNRLISTIRLPDLIAMTEESPDGVRAAASSLTDTSIDLISVGFNRPDISPALWFYIYDEWIEAARAYSPSWKSPHNAPEGCSSLQFEIYSAPNESAIRTPQYLIENTLKALRVMLRVEREEIILVDHRRVPNGNVIFFEGMEDKRDLCHGWLRAQGIHWAGRFGEWSYLWSNQAYMSGLTAARKLLGG